MAAKIADVARSPTSGDGKTLNFPTRTSRRSGPSPRSSSSSPATTARPTCSRWAAAASASAGLSSAEATQRLQRIGHNVVGEFEGLTRLGVLWNQVKSPLLLLLVFAAVASMATGEWTDAAIVIAIVVVSVGIGYSREYRAQSAAAELRAKVQVHASVLRDGAPCSVPLQDIVPGDVILLSAGSVAHAARIETLLAQLHDERAPDKPSDADDARGGGSTD